MSEKCPQHFWDLVINVREIQIHFWDLLPKWAALSNIFCDFLIGVCKKMWLIEWHTRNTSTTKHALEHTQYWYAPACTTHTWNKHLRFCVADTPLDARYTSYTHLTQVILVRYYTHVTRITHKWHLTRERTTLAISAFWNAFSYGTCWSTVRLVLLRATMFSGTLKRTYIVPFSFVLQRELRKQCRSKVEFNVVLKFPRELRMSWSY